MFSADIGLLDAAGEAWKQRASALQGECDRARLHQKATRRGRQRSLRRPRLPARRRHARQKRPTGWAARPGNGLTRHARWLPAYALRPRSGCPRASTDPDLTLEELQDLAWDDPDTVLPDLEVWREQAGDWAEDRRRPRGESPGNCARRLTGHLAEASQARDEAERLRSGTVLLPLP